jgi:type IV pilus assembly protein PilM
MQIFSPKSANSIVGLEIEADSIAAAEVHVNGSAQIRAHGIVPLPSGVFRDGEITDHEALSEALKELFAKYKLPRQVRVGVANQRVVVRSMRLPEISDPKQLETAIRFTAQDHIPMPLEQAVLDWEVVGHGTGANGERVIELVVVAARREMLDGLIGAMRDAGLRPIGIDLSAFAMIRALGGLESAAEVAAAPNLSYEERTSLSADGIEAPVAPASTKLYCGFGDVLNLAVAKGRACLFARVSPFGVEGIAQALAERRQLELVHARQWLVHVGLSSPTDEIEGDPEIIGATREVLAEGARKLAEELRRSLEYYDAQEGATPVESVLACGPGVAIPGLIERVQGELGIPVGTATPAALATFDRLTAGRLVLAYGLALEE